MSGYGVDSIGSIGGYDQYLAAALNSYNPNFRGSQPAATHQADTTTVSPSFEGTSSLPKADYSKSSDSGLISGLIVGGALAAGGAATLIYASKKGNGKGVVEGFKNIWKGITGRTSEKAAEAAEAVAKGTKPAAKPLENLKIVIDKTTGKPVYYVPGKTVTTSDPGRISSLLGKDKELKKLTGLRFNSGETTINGATFTLKDGGNSNVIEFMNGKIIKIKNGSGTDITSTFVDASGKLKDSFSSVSDTEFASKIGDYIERIKAGNADLILSKDLALSNINYTTKIGDQVAEVFRSGISTKLGKPQIKKLTTLKECSATSDEVLAYVRKAKAEGKDLSAIIADKFALKGKLPEGYKVGEFELRDGSNILKIVNGEAVGITIGGVKYAEGTDKFLAYMEKHEDSVAKMIKNALKDNKIPKGATIIPA